MERVLLSAFLIVCSASTAIAKDDINVYLSGAKYDDGINAYTGNASETPHRQADLFALATLQFINGVEDFAQGLYRFGFRPDSIKLLRFIVPIPLIPISKNENPQIVRPEDLARLVQNWHDALDKTAKTLADMNGEDFKVRLNLGRVALDINCDGHVDENENLLQLCSLWFGSAEGAGPTADFSINCDLADALWLRGYCHLLMGLQDILQAHDWKGLYSKCAHALFESPDRAALSPYARPNEDNSWNYISDFVLLLHEFHLELARPEKYQQARDRFFKVIHLSRAFWETVDKETDDDCEWIPNVRQTSASGTKVTPEMVDGWKLFLNEMELILKGDRLIPHFRMQKEYGINLAKVMEHPCALDLVEWTTGLAVAPYLEKGEITDPSNWKRFTQAFSGNFMRTAVWFN